MLELTLTGNIGKEPELRTSKNGGQFYTVSVAVSKGKEKTQWIDLIINHDNKVVQYITKGVKVLVRGLPTVNSYTNRNGEIISSQGCSVNFIELLSKKEENEAPTTSSPDMVHDDIPF